MAVPPGPTRRQPTKGRPFRPIAADATLPGFTRKGLVLIGSKDGHWVRLFSSHAERPISRKVRVVTRLPQMGQDMVLLCDTDMEQLKLPAAAFGSDVDTPVPGLTVDVERLLIPRDPKFFFSILTFGLAAATSAVTFLAASASATSTEKAGLGVASLGLALLTAAVGFLSTYLHLS